MEGMNELLSWAHANVDQFHESQQAIIEDTQTKAGLATLFFFEVMPSDNMINIGMRVGGSPFKVLWTISPEHEGETLQYADHANDYLKETLIGDRGFTMTLVHLLNHQLAQTNDNRF